MKAIDGFEVAIERAEHLLAIYDLVCDTQQEGEKSDWIRRFDDLIHRSVGDKIVRVDGKGGDSILIMKQSVGISSVKFTHEYSSELLRAALVMAVSALDKYMHDVVVECSWDILNFKEGKYIKKELRETKISVIHTKSIIDRLKNDPKSRPGHIVKKAIQEVLHKDTFQSSNEVARAAKMVGIVDLWGKVSENMNSEYEKREIINRLNHIVRRRNQIVHEADVIPKTKAKETTSREIKRDETHKNVQFIKELVYAIKEIK